MNTVITIGRQFGSGGREIGEKLAEHFGIKCYDKELSPTTEPTGPPKAASSKVPKLLVAPSPTFIALRAASA